jgi:hypothetical protein
VDANAHAFQAHHTVDIVASDTTSVPRTYHALFTLGSRVEHSCSPNLTFITKGGKLEYLAETSIKPNDRLSISYLGSVYERPRRHRRSFLKENKVFTCKCVRCMGWDECAPVLCSCEGGVMFFHGARNQWECQSCDKKVTAEAEHVRKQLHGEAELHQRVRKYQYIFETQPYPEMLEEILEIVKSPRWREIIHPLHWLNVEVYKLLSSVAASAARMYVKDQGMEPTSDEASSLLRLSAMSMLRRIIWLERCVAIDRGLISLKDASGACETFGSFHNENIGVEAVKAIVDELCNPKHDLFKDHGTLGVSPAFHAGQDLILAEHRDLAFQVYKRYEVSFRRWKGISDESRNKIKLFVESNGEDNQFGNFLLI